MLILNVKSDLVHHFANTLPEFHLWSTCFTLLTYCSKAYIENLYFGSFNRIFLMSKQKIYKHDSLSVILCKNEQLTGVSDYLPVRFFQTTARLKVGFPTWEFAVFSLLKVNVYIYFFHVWCFLYIGNIPCMRRRNWFLWVRWYIAKIHGQCQLS